MTGVLFIDSILCFIAIQQWSLGPPHIEINGLANCRTNCCPFTENNTRILTRVTWCDCKILVHIDCFLDKNISTRKSNLSLFIGIEKQQRYSHSFIILKNSLMSKHTCTTPDPFHVVVSVLHSIQASFSWLIVYHSASNSKCSITVVLNKEQGSLSCHVCWDPGHNTPLPRYTCKKSECLSVLFFFYLNTVQWYTRNKSFF